MKQISQNRIDIVTRAGNLLLMKINVTTDRNTAENHQTIGTFLKDHPEEILKLIIRKNKQWKISQNTR